MAPSYNRDTKASELVSHYAPLIRGKTIFITGVSPGSLGHGFVKQVAAAKPAIFILASRSIPKMQSVIDELHTAHPDIKVKPLALNLLSFAEVRKAAETVNSWADVPNIDVLVTNAGIMAVPYHQTEDGIESQFQTNHLSHFLLANLVMDKILASKSPRIVAVSSDVHRVGHIRWTDPSFNNGKDYQRWLAYGQSKTANSLMAVALAEKIVASVLDNKSNVGVAREVDSQLDLGNGRDVHGVTREAADIACAIVAVLGHAGLSLVERGHDGGRVIGAVGN
ncbi:hypothetical protein NUW58_g599 [Xylaria curta]|uniref:Uncharacterized protein n=1 Tax=Xylaria curta TaxID=42375 RepID=A0ACC1PQM9_9PEZI|nr:hypothetical protein NUW58_g599 [Xylaria curta]